MMVMLMGCVGVDEVGAYGVTVHVAVGSVRLRCVCGRWDVCVVLLTLLVLMWLSLLLVLLLLVLLWIRV